MPLPQFFSGIGCLHHGLCSAQHAALASHAGPAAEPSSAPRWAGWARRPLSVQPFEIHDGANRTYTHNFAPPPHGIAPADCSPYHAPITQDIRSLTATQLDATGAWLWLLSPPCQPYTRLGERKDVDDPRAAAMLHLIQLLPELQRPPTHLLLENVVGFEQSETRRRLVDALRSVGFAMREFHLSPTDLGQPNQRSRYFLLAQRGAGWGDASDLVLRCQLPSGDDGAGTGAAQAAGPSCLPLSGFLDADGEAAEGAGAVGEDMAKYSHLLDVVRPSDRRCRCFTKNYTRCATGAGSVLSADEGSEPSDAGPSVRGLRWFSVGEISRLHGFGQGGVRALEWPPQAVVSTAQKYQLLGNSMHVGVVAVLLGHLLPAPGTAQGEDRPCD